MSYCDNLPSHFCRRLSVVGLSTPLNFSSETPGPIFFKLHVNPSVEGGLKICTNGHGPLIKMATMRIYGKNLKSSPEPRKLWGRILVHSIMDSRSTKFVQMMTLG